MTVPPLDLKKPRLVKANELKVKDKKLSSPLAHVIAWVCV